MIFIFSLLSLYCALLLVLHIGWHRAMHQRPEIQRSSYPLISVIIPVRNEEGNIQALMDSLRSQSYGNFEVIVVNDHSTDQTMHKLAQHRFASVTIITSNNAGKKSAIEAGVALAKGEIIVTTDADCSPGEHWLSAIQKTFADKNVMLAFGAVGMKPGNIFSQMQAVEFASLIATAAATAALRFPTMCNGANLAYRKSVFNEVRGYEGNRDVASGEDEFLMRKVRERYPGGITFIPFTAGAVITVSQNTLTEFINQRVRWAGKWRRNTSPATVSLAVFIFLSQLAVVAATVSLVSGFDISLAILLQLKLVLEAILLLRACRFSRVPFSFPAFLILQLIYPIYVIAVGILSNFITPSWKGRSASV